MGKGELILRCLGVIGTTIMGVAVTIGMKDPLLVIVVALGGLYLSLREYE